MKKNNLLAFAATQKRDGFQGQWVCILPKKQVKFCIKNVLCKNLYITDIGYYPTAVFHSRFREKGCLQYILIHCVRGKGWYQVEKKRYEVKSSQFFIIPADMPHNYEANIKATWTIFWVYFTGDLAPFYYELLTKKKSNGPVDVIVNPSRELLFDDTFQHLEFMNNTENINDGNSCFFSYLSSFQLSQLKISVHENDVLQQCITFMKDNLHKPLRLKDLCDALLYPTNSATKINIIFHEFLKTQ